MHEPTGYGHDVLIETGAGLGSAISEAEFVTAGDQMVQTADTVWAEAELLLKVKEPVPEDYHRMRPRTPSGSKSPGSSLPTPPGTSSTTGSTSTT